MKIRNLFLFGMVIAIFCSVLSVVEATEQKPEQIVIGIGLGENPPYYYDEGAKKPGTMIELMQRVADNLKLNILFKRMPWKRRLFLVESNDLEGTLFASFKQDRLKIGKYPMKDGQPDVSKNTMIVAYYFYKQGDSSFSWDGEAFHNLDGPICVQHGSAIVDVLIEKEVTVDESKQPIQCLEKLLLGRVAAVVELGNYLDAYLIKEPEKFKDVVKLPTPIREKPYYLMMSHGFADTYPETTKRIWNEIENVRKSDEYKKILQDYLKNM